MENNLLRCSCYLNTLFVQDNEGPHYLKLFLLIATTKATSTSILLVIIFKEES